MSGPRPTGPEGFDPAELEALAPVGRGLFSVDGMWCPSCAAATERVLARQPGVRRARVSFPTASALIDWDPGRADLSRILGQVERLGYAVGRPQSSGETVAQIDAEIQRLSIRLAVTAFFGMWVMVLAIMRYLEPAALGDTPAGHALSLVAAGLALPVVTFAAAPFWRAGWRTLRAGVPGMDALVSLGVAGAAVLSAVELARGGADIYADTAVMLVALLSLGRLVEMRTTRRAATAIGALEREMPERAWPAEGGAARPAESFAPGDRIRVPAGARVPLDGRIEGGGTRFDLSMMTGESRPVPGGAGDAAQAGAVNLDSPVTLRVTAGVGDRRIDRIMGRMAEMQGERSEIARLSDALARRLVPAALTLAALVGAAGWALGLGAQEAALRALSVVVIACPCALSIAVPVTFLAFAERALRGGVLFRSPAAMERAGDLRTLVLDKTGTLTEGRPRVVETCPAPGTAPQTLRDLAATAEAGIDHPVARALTEAGEAGEATRTRHPRGVTARTADGAQLDVGDARALRDAGVPLTPRGAALREGWIHVARAGRWIGALRLADPIRPEAGTALAALRDAGLRLVMATGDAAQPAQEVAEATGLTHAAVHAGLSPEDKAALVADARAHGPVGFAGDGVNDSLALAAADVGIAVDGASHAATAAAGVVVSRGGLGALADGLRRAQAARRRMAQNLAFAVVYNAAAIPLAAAGAIPPSAAALAMLASSLSVLANAGRPEPEQSDRTRDAGKPLRPRNSRRAWRSGAI